MPYNYLSLVELSSSQLVHEQVNTGKESLNIFFSILWHFFYSILWFHIFRVSQFHSFLNTHRQGCSYLSFRILVSTPHNKHIVLPKSNFQYEQFLFEKCFTVSGIVSVLWLVILKLTDQDLPKGSQSVSVGPERHRWKLFYLLLASSFFTILVSKL